MAQLFFGGVCIREGVKWSAFNIHIYLLPVWIAGLSSFQEGLFSIEPWGEQVDFFSPRCVWTNQYTPGDNIAEWIS